jgi:hypothetical protein
MENSALPQLGPDQQVTASDLVRHFGIWQDRAARAPVYVHHRGRLRLVLLSLELMDSLCAPHAGDAAAAGTLIAPLIDAITDVVVLFGNDGRLVHANAAARLKLGDGAQPTRRARALSQASGMFLEDAVARVLGSGTGETLDLIPDRFPHRRLQARIDILPDGCILVAHDATAHEEARVRAAELHALERAIEVSNIAARARVNPRGYLIEPDAALARMTGTTAEQLAVARFLTLIAVGDRARVGDMIEYVSANSAAVGTRAQLLVHGATAIPVALGLAPVERAGRVEEVSILLTPVAP